MSARRRDLSILAMILLATVVALLAVFPLGMVVYGSFRSAAPGQAGFFTLSGYQAAFTDPAIGKALWTTLWLGIVRSFVSMALAVFFCWALVRTDMPLKGAIEFCLWINFFLPILRTPLTENDGSSTR